MGLSGKVLPVLKANLPKSELEYYSEYINEIVQGLDCPNVSLFNYDEYLNNAYHYLKLADYLRNHEDEEFDNDKIKELAHNFKNKEYKILLLTEYDDGLNSPFDTKTFQAYSISSEHGTLKPLGKGSCHYNGQISTFDMFKYAVQIFLITIVMQPILRFTRIITIPESCINSMSYLLCPLAFILGAFLPYLIVKFCYVIGFSLPDLESDFTKSIHWLVIIFVAIRYTPSVLLSTLCYRLNIYEEYVKEKWFMCLTILGGALGNIVWILTDHYEVSVFTLLKMIFSFGCFREVDFANEYDEQGHTTMRADLYTEELNPYARYDTHELICLSVMFV